jgi:meiotic recombination protein SPO11
VHVVNQRYIEELDRNVLGNKTSKRTFLNSSHVRKTAITTRVTELVHEVLSKVLCHICISLSHTSSVLTSFSHFVFSLLHILYVVYCILYTARQGIHITKRDLFYTDVKLFKDQGESDAVLDDVACMVGCTRTNLHVVASDKG